MIDTAKYNSPVGELLLAAHEDTLIGLWFINQRHFPLSLLQNSQENPDNHVLCKVAAWLDRYFAGERPKLAELKLAPQGSEFQRMVCDIMCRIPYGEVITYGEIARLVAQRMSRTRMSAQAVGGAVGRNSIAIIIPCHRVVGTNGKLTGYAGGIDRKKWLLQHEGWL